MLSCLPQPLDHFADMKIRSLKFAACASLLMATAGAAFAGTAVQSQSVQEILQVQHALRDKLGAPHGEYSGLKQDAVGQVESAQDKIFGMLQGVTSLDQLNEGQKTQLFNAQEVIRATMLANAGDRKICHHERKTGSNMIQVRCETASQREKNMEESHKFMNDERAQYKQGS